jgi:hypothetical protein
MANKPYKLPSYPNSKNQDVKNNAIMAKMRELKAAGATVPIVAMYNVNPGPPSVVEDFKKPKKK